MSGILAALAGGSGGRQLTVGASGLVTYGFASALSIGSLTPDDFLEANIIELAWTANTVIMEVDAVVANSGWTSVSINGTVFLRTSATYTNPSGLSAWQWTGVSTNPFGTTAGVIIPVNIA